VAFNGQRHRLLKGGVAVLRRNCVAYVGPRSGVAADRRIDARRKLAGQGPVEVQAMSEGDVHLAATVPLVSWQDGDLPA
jgi:hypothetical protein